MQFFTLGSSKIFSNPIFFDTMISYNDHPRYVKHVLGCIYVLLTLLGRGGGSPKGLVHNLLIRYFTLGCSKVEVFETCFFDIVIT